MIPSIAPFGMNMSEKMSTLQAKPQHFSQAEMPAYQHTMQRVREKMKHTGFISTPETPQQQDILTEEGVNLRVKEAIARKQAQRYGKIAPMPAPVQKAMTAPDPLSSNTDPSITGNAFLHAMAQHMDTDGKENIAKALQQNKPHY